MQTITLQIAVSDDYATLTLTTTGTAWEDIEVDSLAIEVYGEDKTSPLHSFSLSSSEVDDLQDDSIGLQAASSSVIPEYETNDNFYSIVLNGLDANGVQVVSNWVAIGYSLDIESKFRNHTVGELWKAVSGGFTPKATNVLSNVMYSNSNFFLEDLKRLSTSADYGYDREIAWRKIYKVLDTYYGN